MSLSSFLGQLSLTTYQAALSAKGVAELEQLLALPDPDLDALLASTGMLKGHAFKLKKAVEAAKKPDALKRPRPEDSPAAPRPLPPKPGVLAKPGVPPKPGVPAQKPTTSLTKEVERLISKLGEIEQVRDDIQKAKEMILAIDLERYRRGLDQVEFIQKTLSAMEEVSEEMAAETEPAQDMEVAQPEGEYAQE